MDLLLQFHLPTSKCVPPKIDKRLKKQTFSKEFTMDPRIYNSAIFNFWTSVVKYIAHIKKKKKNQRKNLFHVRNLYLCAMVAHLIVPDSL